MRRSERDARDRVRVVLSRRSVWIVVARIDSKHLGSWPGLPRGESGDEGREKMLLDAHAHMGT